MEKINRGVVAAVALLVLMSVMELARPVVLLGEDPKEMRVVNTAAEPVPTTVQGVVGVTGAVQAQQSGPWQVGILGTPQVKVLNTGQTRLLMDDDYNGMPTGTSTFATPIDVSPFAKVRVSITINGSGDIRFTFYSGTVAGGPNQNLRRIETVETDNAFTRVFDVPGVSLHIGMVPSSSNNQALIQVYGH